MKRWLHRLTLGYSYGSLLAAQTANWYAHRGHKVHNLVLIGSPIDRDFLAKLRANQCISNLLIVDLREYGDPIYADMTQQELLMAAPVLARQQRREKGEGHFYYAHVTSESPLRWKKLAEHLFAKGLR